MAGNAPSCQARLFDQVSELPGKAVGISVRPRNISKRESSLERKVARFHRAENKKPKLKRVQGQYFNTETGNFVCPDCDNDVGIGWVIKGIAYCSKCGPKHLSDKGKKHWGLN